MITPQQTAITNPVPHTHVLLMNNHAEECEHILSQSFHEQTKNDGKRRYLTPETSDDLSKLNKIEKRFSDEIITLRGKEHLNPTKADEQRQEIFPKFNWDEFLLHEDKKTRLGHLLVRYR